jgi:hypothetical protein
VQDTDANNKTVVSRLHSFVVYIVLPSPGVGHLRPNVVKDEKSLVNSCLKQIFEAYSGGDYVDVLNGHTPSVGYFTLKFAGGTDGLVARSYLAVQMPIVDLTGLHNLLLSGLSVVDVKASTSGLRRHLALMGHLPVDAPPAEKVNVIMAMFTFYRYVN